MEIGWGQAHPVLPALPGAGCCGISAAGDAQGDPRPARPLLHGSPRQGPFWKPRPPALDFHLFRAGDTTVRQPDRPLPDRRERGQVPAQAGEVLRGPGRGSDRGCRQVRGGHSGRDPHRPEGSEAPPHRRPGLGSQCEGRSTDLTHVQRTPTRSRSCPGPRESSRGALWTPHRRGGMGARPESEAPAPGWPRGTLQETIGRWSGQAQLHLLAISPTSTWGQAWSSRCGGVEEGICTPGGAQAGEPGEVALPVAGDKKSPSPKHMSSRAPCPPAPCP